jgi:signal transduction histidine kinase
VLEALRSIGRTTAFRLAVAYLGAFVLAAALIIGAIFLKVNAELARQSLATVAAELEGLAALAVASNPSALGDAVAERSRQPGPGLYFLADPQGRKLAGNLNRWPPELADRPEGGLFTYSARRGGLEREHLGVAIPAVLPEGQRLLVGRDLEEQRVFIDRVKRLLLAGLGALSALGIAGGVLASRLALRRVDRINQATRTIMAGDLSQRLPVADKTRGDEIDDLAENLNAMLERNEQLMAGLREVSDNIAHDLKTPLTRLRSRAEAALRSSDDPKAHRDGLERAIEDADELIKTFNALLLIARLEAGAVAASLEEFDLSEVVESAAELYEPLAEQRGLTLTCEVAAGVCVRANRQLIGQAVANLIDNAIKHAGDGRQPAVHVALAKSSAGPEISVSDRGAGIAAADRERVMKRFVRLETSRTVPGTGLGLSLVAAVARLHGGSVRLEDNAPGLRAVLALPAGIVRGPAAAVES